MSTDSPHVTNHYHRAANDPLNRTDPTGLDGDDFYDLPKYRCCD